MASLELLRFVDSVVRFHELATGLKSLKSHQQIVAYAQSQHFDFTEAEWTNFFNQDFLSQSGEIQESIRLADPAHWSWAFRQLSGWRAMLMEGAGDGRS